MVMETGGQETFFEIVPSSMWENALLQTKMLLLLLLHLVLRRNWLYRILKIWNEKVNAMSSSPF